MVSLKGEEKSRKQERCYHGADGGVQKVEMTSTPEPAKKRGLRGKIAESKKEELTTYPSDVTLDGKAKKLTVAVKNSGYRKAN